MNFPKRGSLRRSGRPGGNAAACMAFLPVWSVSYSLSFFYLSLYFRQCGVSDAQLGFLVTAGSGASLVFSFLAAPLVDRMGRKKATLVFDVLGTALPFLLYALRGDFVFALAGTLISNSSRVMNVGYFLLMSEDSGNEERARAFNAMNIVMIAAGLLAPAAGYFVATSGVSRAERWILAASALAIAGAALARDHFVRETETGKALMIAARGRGNGEERGKEGRKGALFGPYAAAVRYLRTDRRAAAAAAANVLFYVYYLVGTNNSLYFAPFFADALGMKPADVGIAGAVYTAGTLAAMLFVNPLVFRKQGTLRCAAAGALLNIAGFAPLVFLGKNTFAWAIASLALAAVGYGMLKSAIDAALATCFGQPEPGGGLSAGEEARSGVYSLANFLSSAFGMAAGGLCSLFYPSAPRFMPALSIAILAAVALSLRAASGPRNQSASSRLTS